MRAFLAETPYGERVRTPAQYIWFGKENEGVTEEAWATHYQSRKAPRSEYRLYFPQTSVSCLMQAGDTLFVAKKRDGDLLIIVARNGSTIENQLFWLFGITGDIGRKFEIRQVEECHDLKVDYVVRYILEELGIEPEAPETPQLDSWLEKFGGKFPKTAVFSEFAREIVNTSPLDDPDATLVQLMETEEKLFLRLERQILSERLHQGFVTGEGADVEGFIRFSLSVQNRRKSRVGYALENHLSWIFNSFGLRYARGAETENGKKPDFIFPGREEYTQSSFPPEALLMLGVKSTCKDRWRQVLDEATRIPKKHLLTLEPGISESQTRQMQEKDLQLVLPAQLHQTYKPQQQLWLYSVADFIRLAQDRQRHLV
jgi:hypothetical protein